MSSSLKSTTGSELPFHPAVVEWFTSSFRAATAAQQQAWPEIGAGHNTLLLAPTGSGKTLAAFLVAIDRILFAESPPETPGVRTLYLSPLKALGVDVERNLRAPLAGIVAVADRHGLPHQPLRVGVRSGDTPSSDRAKMMKAPPEILITTPESLFLILTSQARKILTTVDTVIIDEIHSMVSTKRGAHLFLSLERLERQRTFAGRDVAMQRVGLSATQRPLDEIARLLGGAECDRDQFRARPVSIIEAGRRKPMDLSIEVPVEDMTDLASNGPASVETAIPSIWPSIHPRLVALIRQHRSTMIFVNSRRLAERMATAINETAEEEIALAHHGSIAKDRRLLIEDRLKRGTLPAIVATSSLELGIDMGAVDLVIQIEAPPSVASGIQRIGRAGHHVDGVSKGVVFPKYRGDLLACSAAVTHMLSGHVEETRYPRNPLDVLAQQLVAMVALEDASADELYDLVRCAAPFAELPRSAFDGLLDLLSGRYPSDEFAELRARINWDRLTNRVSPRRGTQRLAIANAGTIPDRGLYGVFLPSQEDQRANRVGELDEEMVFECNPGDVFLLGASSWRVLEITHERVIVEPAAGEPGRMPFWRGDGIGRPLDFGRAIGKLTRELTAAPPDTARRRLMEQHALDARAASNLLTYLHEQVDATGRAPSDKTIVIEQFLDEIGDWRIAILSPFGARVHAPWATAVAARLRQEFDVEVDMMHADDGMVFRLAATDEPPDYRLFLPTAEEIEDLVTRELGGTALFAARFRENAARALLLPRRQPGRRTPLWLQRRKSADLLNVAARYPKFPIMLETYRECLRDVFDLPGLQGLLNDIAHRRIAIEVVRTSTPSPFASALMFNYTANFIYNGDAPLAERRAATLVLDQVQLKELLGEAPLRDLLDAESLDELVDELLRRKPQFGLRDADSIHDLLRYVGDLTRDELATWPRHDSLDGDAAIDELVQQRRIVALTICGQSRFVAVEDVARYRDAIGCVPPMGIPHDFLEPVENPLVDLVSRFARTHIPFHPEQLADRWGLGVGPIRTALKRLAADHRVVDGEFLPGGRGQEWCDTEVLRKIKRRSLAKLREQVEPVEAERYAAFLARWHAIDHPRRGLDGLLDAIDQLQGLPLPYSEWLGHVLPLRVEDFQATQLDTLCAAGELVWQGHGALGTHDGRISLYLADAAPALSRTPSPIEDPLEQQIAAHLKSNGASFFDAIATALGGFRNDLLDALWRLVWNGHVTNDTTAPLRALADGSTRRKRQHTRFRSRRASRLSGSEGRWSLWWHAEQQPSPTERQTALAWQLIERHGILTRDAIGTEGVVGGFSAIYPVLKAMEEAGKVRRGYFVEGLGAAQFAAPGAEDRLRAATDDARQEQQLQTMAAIDPANPYGAALRWPENSASSRPQRATGTTVVLWEGRLIGYLFRNGQRVLTFLPEAPELRDVAVRKLLEALAKLALQRKWIYAEIDDVPAGQSPLAPMFQDHGFALYNAGFRLRA